MDLMYHRPDLADAAALPQTTIASETFHNVYVYTARRLWISYVVPLLCASTAVALGLHTIFTSGASYSNQFSTVLRVARHSQFDHEVDLNDEIGRDPLPKHLARSRLTMASMNGDSEETTTKPQEECIVRRELPAIVAWRRATKGSLV